jgi:DNA-binding transcriptional ArsR family regulator
MDKFTAISEPTRRGILEILAREGKLSATEIGTRFPISAPAISQHLKILREAGLVRVERSAQKRLYEIEPGAVDEVGDWAARMVGLWNERFDAIDALLTTQKNGDGAIKEEKDGKNRSKNGKRRLL